MANARAAFLIIGNEVLSGRTQDRNLTTLAHALRKHGILLAEVRVVRDDHAAIVTAVTELRKTFDYLFTSGGIGPTHDDITTSAVAAAFGVEVYRHPQAEAALTEHYQAQGKEASPQRLRMADIPAGAKLVNCEVTPAPGFNLENVYVFAGVPLIFAQMVASAIPTLPAGASYASTTITVRVGESEVSDELEQVQDNFTQLELGSYPQQDQAGFYTELVIAGSEQELIAQASEQLTKLLRDRKLEFEIS